MFYYEVFTLGLDPRSAEGLISTFLTIFNQEDADLFLSHCFTKLDHPNQH